MSFIPDSLPVFGLPNNVLYPEADLPIRVVDPRNKLALLSAIDRNKLVAVALQKNPWLDSAAEAPQLFEVGIAAAITTHHKLPDGHYNVFLHGLKKVRIGPDIRLQPFRTSVIQQMADGDSGSDATVDQWRLQLMDLIDRTGPQEVFGAFPRGTHDRLLHATPANFVALVSSLLGLRPHEQQSLLELDGTGARIQRLVDIYQMTLLRRAKLGDGDWDGQYGFTH